VTDKLSRTHVLTRTIQDEIKRYITANGLQPGDLLPPEGQLAADFGVSRGSVREAIKGLESLGILEIRHGTGIVVRQFNFDSVYELLSYGLVFDQTKIAEILQVRKWLEVSAISVIVDLISEEQVAEMEALLARWEEQAAAQVPTSDEDRAFHSMLYAPLRNQALVALLDVFWLVFHSTAIRDVTTDREPTTTLEDHRAILTAVKQRDPALATAQMRRHFGGLEARIATAGIELQPVNGRGGPA